MAKITHKITRLDEGMSTDIRSDRGFARVQHFKVFPHKLVPQFSTEANETKTMDIVKFIYAPWLSTTDFRLFGLSVKNGTAIPAINFKGSDPIDSVWGTPANAEGSSGARSEDVFFYYKGYLYGFKGNDSLWRYGKIDDTSSSSFTDQYQSITYTSVAQPVHHPNDDCAYFFADNKVYRLRDSTWDGDVLTLPSNLKIVSANPVGNYLEIACVPVTGIGNSTSFLWDRDSSLETVSERIDWGEGNVVHTAYINGVLVAVINYFMDSSFSHDRGKLIIKSAGGQFAPKEFDVDDTEAGAMTGNKFVTNDRLYFPLRLNRNGSTWEGIASVDATGKLVFAFSEEEVTDGRIQGIYKLGEFWFIAHSNDGSVNRTNDQDVYAYDSIIETNILGGEDENQFVGATIPCEPLPANASIALKYRKAGDANWTAMKLTKTAATGDKAIHFLLDDNNQAPRFNEVQYQIISTGGAVIVATEETPIEFVHESNDKKPYGKR